MPNGPYELYVTPDQLAERLHVSVDTVDRMERAGVIPKAIRSRAPGSGRGRCVKRWDMWIVGRHLAGDDTRKSA